MFQWLKKLLKRFLPPPVNSFNREIERVLGELSAIKDSMDRQSRRIESLEVKIGQRIDTLEVKIGESRASLLEMQQFENGLAEAVHEVGRQAATLLSEEKRSLAVAVEGRRAASESVWADIFNNTIAGFEWMHGVSFSPGRWAVGYPYLYAMFRVLQEARPQRILELGMGQTTKMIAKYASEHEDVIHFVVEHDREWIDFCRNGVVPFPSNTHIVRLDLSMRPYKDAEAVRTYEGFQEEFRGQQFDFISVDAPLGADMKQFARIDLLSILPGCLSERFVIMIDDSERIGEINMIRDLEQCLQDNGILYQKGRYSGQKDCTLICAKHLGFLCSM